MNIEGLDSLPFSERLKAVHRMVHQSDGLGAIGRISIATYVPGTDELRTFSASDRYTDRPKSYVAHLGDIPSLKFLSESNRVRIIDDLAGRFAVKKRKNHPFDLKYYKSSMAIPVKHRGKFCGFIFFDSSILGFFDANTIGRVMPAALLIRQMLVAEFDALRTLQAAVQTAKDIGNLRDYETARHLRHIAAYSRLIARHMAAAKGLSDEWIEKLEQFAPLHDVGKLGIPDQILRKTGTLDDNESAIMRSHVHVGLEIVKTILRNFGLDGHPFAPMLYNVVAHHHETMDGLGYPASLVAQQISLEGRIVAVADIFDTLTSPQPDKAAWPIDVALSYLLSLAGVKLDSDCVSALVSNRAAIHEIVSQSTADTGGVKN